MNPTFGYQPELWLSTSLWIKNPEVWTKAYFRGGTGCLDAFFVNGSLNSADSPSQFVRTFNSGVSHHSMVSRLSPESLTYKCLNHWTRAYFRGSTKWLCESLTGTSLGTILTCYLGVLGVWHFLNHWSSESMKTWIFGVSQFLDVRQFLDCWPTSALNFGIWVTLGAAPGDLNYFLNLTGDYPESSWTQLLSTSLNFGVSHFVHQKPTCWDFSTIGAAPLTLMPFFWMIHWKSARPFELQCLGG